MGDLDRIQRALAQSGSASSDFDLNANSVPISDKSLRAAAVLVLLDTYGKSTSIILTKRSLALKHHPGQIAFPGGKRDLSDPDLTATALREAQEEIGLPPDMVSVIGHLPAHQTITNYQVTPVVAHISDTFQVCRDPGEVEEVFRVPLEHVLDRNNFQVQARQWQGQKRYYYSVAFGPYYIWGATARILRGLADRVVA
ncbi:MAG: CoA pyrophosphatase [Pseudoprimorskyibacter sp.]|jgi:8-oxo-dGTP pyrophosphatase MutT (NUDIX family)|nr:CoA pyrophosphatase [Pseudoprimorskyibacter sp.]